MTKLYWFLFLEEEQKASERFTFEVARVAVPKPEAAQTVEEKSEQSLEVNYVL